MTEVVVHVKNMVCARCVMAVQDILNTAKLPFRKVIFGEIYLPMALTASQKSKLDSDLKAIGFELIDNHTEVLVERIKNLALKKARKEETEDNRKLKLSFILSAQLNHEYTYLSSLFSSIEGRTIENYVIEQRIEKAKELLIYGQHTLSEIADQLEYSSVAHLSAQFKKVTGLTPSFFKEVGKNKRKALDQI